MRKNIKIQTTQIDENDLQRLRYVQKNIFLIERSVSIPFSDRLQNIEAFEVLVVSKSKWSAHQLTHHS